MAVVTVDGGASTNWETLARLRRTDTRQCNDCHGSSIRDYVARRPNFDGIDVSDPASMNIASLTWDSIKRLRDSTKMKIVLKGLLTQEDAGLATDNGTTRLLFQTMADASSTAAARQSRSCRKSSRRSADESRSSWTAAFVVAPTSSKH